MTPAQTELEQALADLHPEWRDGYLHINRKPGMPGSGLALKFSSVESLEGMQRAFGPLVSDGHPTGAVKAEHAAWCSATEKRVQIEADRIRNRRNATV